MTRQLWWHIPLIHHSQIASWCCITLIHHQKSSLLVAGALMMYLRELWSKGHPSVDILLNGVTSPVWQKRVAEDKEPGFPNVSWRREMPPRLLRTEWWRENEHENKVALKSTCSQADSGTSASWTEVQGIKRCLCLPELGIKHGIITSLKAVFLVAWKTTKETVNLVLMCSVVFQPDGVEGVLQKYLIQYVKMVFSVILVVFPPIRKGRTGNVSHKL